MKVMCIDDVFSKQVGNYHPALWDVVTVVDFMEGDLRGEPHYEEFKKEFLEKQNPVA